MSFVVKKDYYQILGVSPNATADEIKAAYRKAVKQFHPDLHSNNPLANLADEKLKEVNEAYEVLGDEEKRKQYDGFQVEPQNNYNNTSNSDNKKSNANNQESKKAREETSQKERSYNKEESKRERTKETYDGEQDEYIIACHIHKNKPGVTKCTLCGVGLCQECADTFNVVMCPACLNKNNDLYIKSLKAPLMYTLFGLLIGIITGVTVGIKYNIFKDYGALEGLILGVYLTSLSLYLLYFYYKVRPALIKFLEIILYVFDVNGQTIISIASILNMAIGISIGWILGLFWGTIKLRKDYINYATYKTEYIKTKKFIKESFNI